MAAEMAVEAEAADHSMKMIAAMNAARKDTMPTTAHREVAVAAEGEDVAVEVVVVVVAAAVADPGPGNILMIYF